MRITVQFFSQLRECANASEISIELEEGATVRELLAQLYRKFPALSKFDATILVGSGVEFVGRDYPLQPNESIAVMPPVQGG
jgi:molybdopterin converting factor small subunit